jgi:hypothetical protein
MTLVVQKLTLIAQKMTLVAQKSILAQNRFTQFGRGGAIRPLFHLLQALMVIVEESDAASFK